jgi:hypothetical protein
VLLGLDSPLNTATTCSRSFEPHHALASKMALSSWRADAAAPAEC